MNNCNLSNRTIQTAHLLNYTTYTILLPPYLVIGLTGNVILLITFYKQSKLERTYGYQVLLTFSKTLEVAIFGGFQFTHSHLSGSREGSADWFQKNFAIMWIDSKLGFAGHMHMIMCSLMLAVAMSADRLFALTLPFRYKNIDHKKHQLIAALICFSVPAASSIGYAFMIDIVPAGDRFVAQTDHAYLSSSFGAFCFNTGLFLRLTCVFALIALNIAMIIAFRKRTRAITKMTNHQQKKEARKATDKTLFLLNVWQSVLMFLNQSPHVALHESMAINPPVTICYMGIAAPVADAFIFITDSIDLGVVMAINRKIRGAVFTALRCSGQVAPAVPSNPKGPTTERAGRQRTY